MADNTPNGTPPGGSGHDNDYETLNEFIRTTGIALTNAQLPDVLPLLQKKGIKPADITARLADLETLKALSEKQQKEKGDEKKAGQNYTAQLLLLQQDYPGDVELARLDFEDDAAALTTLGLTGRRKRNRPDYTRQALQLYNGALNDTGYATKLADSGIDNAKLTTMRDGFKHLEDLDTIQVAEDGEAQIATTNRDTAWDSLEDYMGNFYRRAKVALKDHPQLREKLGLLER